MDVSINNILINQVFKDGETISFKEVFPHLPESPIPLTLNLGPDGKLYWAPIPISAPHKDPWEGLLFCKGAQVGFGREPLYTYNFDIAVSENQITTALHIGDGRRGFSMGNGTNNGFLPEIIGMGETEQDAGLYILGRAGNNKSSEIPLIILDGRNSGDSYLTNRPILGITSAKYDTYHFIVDCDGKVGIGKKPEIYKMEIDGEISATDLILNGSSIQALIDIIREHQDEIDRIKIQLKQFIDKIK